jgi:hypothetical protein
MAAQRVVFKVEWHVGELFPRVGFIVTNSNTEAKRIITIYNGRAEIENRIKEGKKTLRWDKMFVECGSVRVFYFAGPENTYTTCPSAFHLVLLRFDSGMWSRFACTQVKFTGEIGTNS